MEMADGLILEGGPTFYDVLWYLVGSLRSAAFSRADYADKGVQVCEDIAGQFVDEDVGSVLLYFRAEHAQFHDLAGRFEEGARLLREIIRERPDHPIGYQYLSSLYEWRSEGDGSFEDLKEACRILERALAIPVKDAAKHELPEQHAELQQRIAEVDALV
jgi:hypothetical protein